MPTRNLTFRDATAADLPAIVAIYNEAVLTRISTAQLTRVITANRRAWFDAHTPKRRPLWVAEIDGTIVGWFSFQDFYGRPAYHITAEVSVYVTTKLEGQGIGMRLLQRGIQKAPGVGLKNLVGFVFGHNKGSMKLFERCGFERRGVLPKVADMDGVERDLVIFSRRVG